MAQIEENGKKLARSQQIQGGVAFLNFFMTYVVVPMIVIVGIGFVRSTDARMGMLVEEIVKLRTENQNMVQYVAETNKRISHESVVASTEVVRIGVRQAVLRGDGTGNCVTLVRRYVADPVTGLYDADAYDRKLTSEKGRCST